MSNYIVSVTTEDRVGIVHCVTGTLRELRGNILELSQTVLRGYFTIILSVEFPEPMDASTIRERIAQEGVHLGLTVVVIEADPRANQPAVPNGERFILTVLGDDHVGNIHAISGCLAAWGVNIVDLHARADGSRFLMVMEAFLPPDVQPSVLRDEIEKFGEHLGLEAYVQHENIFKATNEPRPVRVAPRPMEQGGAGVPH